MAENNEGSPWFWKIFGGTIMGMITFLLLAHITQINANIERTKAETKSEINELRVESKDLRIILDHNRERVVMLEQNFTTHKDRIATLELCLKENSASLEDKKQKIAALEATVTHFKEELKAVQEQNGKLLEQIQQIREKMAAPVTPPATVTPPAKVDEGKKPNEQEE